jgi:hypothetical protein
MPMSNTPDDPIAKKWPSRQALLPVVLAVAAAAGIGIYLAAAPPSGPGESKPGTNAAPQEKSPPGAVPGAGASAGKGAPGKLGIAKTNCQGFADIAARFWDLKQAGRPIEFVFGTIEQNSKGDDGKARVLKALALVVYKDRNATRDAAYRNAHEACMKQ